MIDDDRGIFHYHRSRYLVIEDSPTNAHTFSWYYKDQLCWNGVMRKFNKKTDDRKQIL